MWMVDGWSTESSHIGLYSQGFETGGLVITSEQTPVNPANREIATRVERSCKNVGAILAAAEVDFTKVVKTTCFLVDMEDFSAFNEIYAKYFVSKKIENQG